MSDFKDLNLSENLLKELEKKGYLTPTPIQKQSIPHLLKGRDLLGIAQTGTGKTAAFALPILDNLSKSSVKVKANNIRALILTPTRELASQIHDNIKLYGKSLNLKSITLFGGVSINNQIKSMQTGFDIVIATPGRFLDLKNRGHIRLSQVEIFVLDEADRMLDMGFINDVKKVIAALPNNRQNLLFSATMPKDIAVLANEILENPIKVEVTPQATTVEKIDQKVKFVAKESKPQLLKSIIQQKSDKRTILVFSQTKHNANKIAKYLEEQSIKAMVIHGNKSQTARENALDDFRKGKVSVLIATDIAARGIDIPSITHVINYDIPQDPSNYVHRIGRTARAGREGVAISFCSHLERDLLRSVEKTINYKIPIDEEYSLKSLGSEPVKEDKERKFNDENRKNISHFAQGRRHSKSAFESDINPKFEKKEPSKKYFKELGDFKERKFKPKSNLKNDSFKEKSSKRPFQESSDGLYKRKPSFAKKAGKSFSSDHPERPEFSSDRKSRFSNSNRPAKSKFDRDRRESFNPNRPARSENFKKKSFESSTSNNSNLDRSTRANFGNKKPFKKSFDKSSGSKSFENSARFSNEVKPSFGRKSSPRKFGGRSSFKKKF